MGKKSKGPVKEPEALPEARTCQVLVRYSGHKSHRCGGILHEDGFCPIGQGYPYYMEHQPHVCPRCRERLAWCGNCLGCWNTHVKTGPGDYFEEVAGHWQNTGEQQTMFTADENMQALRVLSGVMAGQKVEVALDRIGRILTPEIPF